LLAFATFLRPSLLILLSVALIASGFVGKVREVKRVGGAAVSAYSLRLPGGLALELPGPIFADHERRLSEGAFADAILTMLPHLPAGSMVFVADWYPILTIKNAGPMVRQYPSEQLIAEARERNAPIFYLPDVQRDVLNKTGIDLVARGARVLDPGDVLRDR